MWGSSSPFSPTSPILAFEYAGYAGANVLGIWGGTDTDALTHVNILNGSADGGTVATLHWVDPDSFTITLVSGDPAAVNAGIFHGIPFASFGFFLQGPGTGGGRFYTVDQLNGGDAQAVAYNPTGDEWVIAFEDLQLRKSDYDYNDLVFRIGSLQPVPAPATVVLLGSGMVAVGVIGLARKVGRRSR